MQIKRALISVSDKSLVDTLAKKLSEKGVEIISSGGTRKFLEEQGLTITPIESVTGNPEAFGGRMKTLSFQISSALLYRRDHSEDIAQAKELSIQPIDLVVCNLYPFEEVMSRGGEWDELIENIDIGGPTMVRASAKNHKDVVCLTSPSQYEAFLNELGEGNECSLELSKRFALEAFQHTANYDSMIAATLDQRITGETNIFHGDLTDKSTKITRYGENPHQKGAVVLNKLMTGKLTLASAPCLQGKELSYNNYLDADAAWRCNSDLHTIAADLPYKHCVTVVKHSNPCGAAIAETSIQALEKAWNGDPISSFGSIIAFSHEVDAASASFICERFVEVILAPSFSSEALELFSKKKNLRLIELPPHFGPMTDKMIRTIHGGLIVQDEDTGQEEDIKVVTQKTEINTSSAKALFGIKICKHLKSNAIVLINEDDNSVSIAGAGMGNPNRLVSIHQASEKARENGFATAKGLLLVSDAFFPFRDNIDLAHSLEVSEIIQPGGSIKDQEVINACNEFGITMAFTGMRHFRH